MWAAFTLLLFASSAGSTSRPSGTYRHDRGRRRDRYFDVSFINFIVASAVLCVRSSSCSWDANLITIDNWNAMLNGQRKLLNCFERWFVRHVINWEHKFVWFSVVIADTWIISSLETKLFFSLVRHVFGKIRSHFVKSHVNKKILKKQ